VELRCAAAAAVLAGKEATNLVNHRPSSWFFFLLKLVIDPEFSCLR
jgi:hypothetical protein